MKISLIIAVTIVYFTIGFTDGKKDRIKLRDVSTLTLHHGLWTTGRRTRPVPQLQCIGGTAMCKTLPQTIQCYNRGSDGVDIQWECKADLDQNLRFNKIEVTCEGYDYPEDDYVLVGSCGLEYSIDTVDGKRPFPEPRFDRPDPRNIPKSHQFNYKKDGPGIITVVVLGSIAFLMWTIYRNCIVPLDDSRRRRGQPSGPSVPPPPQPGFKFSSTGDESPSSHTTGQQNDTGAGFWSGLGLGTLLGYVFGSRNDGRNQRLYPDISSDTPGYTRTTRREYEEPEATSGWHSFWSGGSARRRRPDTTSTPSTSSETSTHSTSTGEVSRNASGFGGTKRR